MNILFFCITTGIAGASMLVRVAADDEVDLVDVEQLGVDARHRRADWSGRRSRRA